MICASCKTDNPPQARFCNQCGARLGEPAPEQRAESRNYTPRHLAERILKNRGAMQGERKRVTVLFCDIKGSTKLAQEAGAELWHEILDRFFSILAGAVHRYEGTVNQYTGDGIMALFGAPVAHEDHAQRASHAALQMQAEVRRYADELRLKKGLNLSMRIGLNSGEVIVGRIGDDLRMDYTAQGVTVNLAARMEHICEPGRIYLSRYTATQVQGYFKLRDLGRMSVDGLDEPVEVYELEGTGSLRTRLDRSLARGGSQFVGRDSELAALLAALERVKAGEGQVLAVVGNAGIGKSRLCHEFAIACEESGIAVHRATGVPYANALPLYPVQSLLRSRLGLPENAAAAEVRRLVAGTFLLHDPANAAILPAVFDFLGAQDSGAKAPDQASAARAQMFELFARWLPAADQAQILLVEDLHFLDAASEEFLAALCARVRATPTLLLLNYRPDYLSERLIPCIDEQIAVSALGAEQLERLAEEQLGAHPSLAGIARQIRERAAGNPFFVEEAVQALAESGHLQGERGSYELVRPIAEWPIPDTVHALLAARIDRLPDESKTLLQTAAVIGQEFQPRQLVALAEIESTQFDPQIAVLEESGFVHQRRAAGGLEYAFCHPLMQEVAYHGQLESRRAQAHARLAAALELQHPLSAPATAEAVRIAHHWRRAGEWARAGAWNLHAAHWAGSRDVDATLQQFRLAMDNLDRAPESEAVHRQRIAARAGIIRIAQFTGIGADEVDRVYAEARRMADDCGDFVCATELTISYGNEYLHRGDTDAAVRLAEETARLCQRHGQGELVARFRLGFLLMFNAAGRPREGVALMDEICGSGWRTEPIGEDNFMSRGFYGLMQAWMGHLQDAEVNLRSALDYAVREDRAASWMHANLVDLAWFSGRPDEALAEARRAYGRAESFGSPFFRALALRALGRAHNLLGEHALAIPHLEEARPLVAPGAAAHQFEANLLATLADAYNGAGRAHEAHEAALAALTSAQKSHSRVWEIAAWGSFLHLPHGGPWEARVPEGLARWQELIETSGATGFAPWLALARAHWSRSEEERLGHLRAAQAGFAAIGAHGHVARLQPLLAADG